MVFVKDELEQNGIASCIPEVLTCEWLSQELDYALRPNLHERKIQPYGFIVCHQSSLTVKKNLSELMLFDLKEARKIADGCHIFIVFSEGEFKGVLILEQGIDNELKLCEFQEDLNAVICTTDSQGVTKVICNSGVFIHEYRRWRIKPSVKQMMKQIKIQITSLDSELLETILKFCFHELSPRNIGTIIVWSLEENLPDKIQKLLPKNSLGKFKKEAKIPIDSPSGLAVLRHLLAFTDGAMLVDLTGNIVGVGIHLKYSEYSRQFLEAYKGTRHTSAQRFSYDFPETLVFVVSDDGPVTVFSQGQNIAKLQECSCYKST